MSVYFWKELFEILLYLFIIRGNFSGNLKYASGNVGVPSQNLHFKNIIRG